MWERIEAPAGDTRHRGSRLELRVVPLHVDGGVIEKEVVVHPGAVVILPLLPDDRLVLIRNTRVAVGRQLWELPAYPDSARAWAASAAH